MVRPRRPTRASKEKEIVVGLGDMVNKAVDKAKEMGSQHPDQVDGALAKGSERIQDRTPDSIDAKVDTGADKAGEYLTGRPAGEQDPQQP
ncbi:MAG: antitoxin [Mycobacteriaceae bacterium]